MKKERKLGQKISLFFSILCYLMSILSIIFATYWQMRHGTQDPIFASALASIFFFVSCGFILQFIANANLPDLKITH